MGWALWLLKASPPARLLEVFCLSWVKICHVRGSFKWSSPSNLSFQPVLPETLTQLPHGAVKAASRKFPGVELTGGSGNKFLLTTDFQSRLLGHLCSSDHIVPAYISHDLPGPSPLLPQIFRECPIHRTWSVGLGRLVG